MTCAPWSRCRARGVRGGNVMNASASHDGSQATCMQAVPHGGRPAGSEGTRQEGDLHRPQEQRQTAAIAGSRSAQHSHSVSLHLRVPRSMGQTNDPRAGPPPPGDQRGALRRLLPRWLPAVQLSACEQPPPGPAPLPAVWCVRPRGAVRGCCTLLLLGVSCHTILTCFLHCLSTCAAAPSAGYPAGYPPPQQPVPPAGAWGYGAYPPNQQGFYAQPPPPGAAYAPPPQPGYYPPQQGLPARPPGAAKPPGFDAYDVEAAQAGAAAAAFMEQKVRAGFIRKVRLHNRRGVVHAAVAHLGHVPGWSETTPPETPSPEMLPPEKTVPEKTLPEMLPPETTHYTPPAPSSCHAGHDHRVPPTVCHSGRGSNLHVCAAAAGEPARGMASLGGRGDHWGAVQRCPPPSAPQTPLLKPSEVRLAASHVVAGLCAAWGPWTVGFHRGLDPLAGAWRQPCHSLRPRGQAGMLGACSGLRVALLPCFGTCLRRH